MTSRGRLTGSEMSALMEQAAPGWTTYTAYDRGDFWALSVWSESRELTLDMTLRRMADDRAELSAWQLILAGSPRRTVYPALS